MQIIIWTTLNASGWNLELEADKSWLNDRIDLINEYTLCSIDNQTDQDFLYFLEIREDTFEYVKDRIKVKKDICFIKKPPCYKKPIKWDRQPQDIKKYVKDEIFYDVRLNSDDMYHKDFVKKLKKVKIEKNTEVIIPQQGYYWYLQEDIVIQRKRKFPPFYALIYNTKNYLNGFRYVLPKGHPSLKLLNYKTIQSPSWCWIVHHINNKIIRGKKYPDPKKYKIVDKSVLKDFTWKD